MKWLVMGVCGVSAIFAAINNKMNILTENILSSCSDAVSLCISLCGIICFWCGIMKIAEKSGAVELLAKLLKPITRLLFKIPEGSRSLNLITMNLVANLLGLGNASTPLGINAMTALAEEENAGDTATDNMIMLVVLNTASLQLIPTTVAALRLKHGTQSAMEILPCVWITSVCALVAAAGTAKLLSRARKRKAHNVTGTLRITKK